jgi:hypothetical protein
VTYWQEYVETDTWYLNELVADVPECELAAACFETDFSISEDECECDAAEEDEDIQWSSEGQSSSEGEDGESSSGSAESGDDASTADDSATHSSDDNDGSRGA